MAPQSLLLLAFSVFFTQGTHSCLLCVSVNFVSFQHPSDFERRLKAPFLRDSLLFCAPSSVMLLTDRPAPTCRVIGLQPLFFLLFFPQTAFLVTQFSPSTFTAKITWPDPFFFSLPRPSLEMLIKLRRATLIGGIFLPWHGLLLFLEDPLPNLCPSLQLLFFFESSVEFAPVITPFGWNHPVFFFRQPLSFFHSENRLIFFRFLNKQNGPPLPSRVASSILFGLVLPRDFVQEASFVKSKVFFTAELFLFFQSFF